MNKILFGIFGFSPDIGKLVVTKKAFHYLAYCCFS